MNKKKLLDVTNAFLALEDLKESTILSPETRRTVEKAHELVKEESAQLVEDEQAAAGESQAAD